MSLPTRRRFAQVDVFTSVSCLGNPVAVVIDSEGLDDATMRRFASWTNLSETVFMLPPTDPSKADYKLRIFTPATELPFAGHPTIGACHVWWSTYGSSGNIKRASDDPNEIVQECGIGLVKLVRDPQTSRLRLAAPPLRKSGPVDAETVARACESVGLDAKADVLDAQWIDNGPGWFALLLPTAKRVLEAKAGSFDKVKDLNFGLVGPYQSRAREYHAALGRSELKYEAVDGEAESEALDTPAFEIRAFCPAESVVEDPVTGSLNAGVGMLLHDLGVLKPERPYVASQGTQLGRAGRVYVQLDEPRSGGDGGDKGQVWVGGDVTPCVEGTVLL